MAAGASDFQGLFNLFLTSYITEVQGVVIIRCSKQCVHITARGCDIRHPAQQIGHLLEIFDAYNIDTIYNGRFGRIVSRQNDGIETGIASQNGHT